MNDEHTKRVIYKALAGSRAYGLEDDASDTDWRGIFLPRAEDHWSLRKVPEQIEIEETQEVYWEVEKFIRLALKANPTVLECLYSPHVEEATPLALELLEIRDSFLSKEVHRTYGRYANSQFRRMETRIRTRLPIKNKHAMHLLRLLMSGAELLETGRMQLDMTPHREELLRVKRGETPWPEVEAWRADLSTRLDLALARSVLPEENDPTPADTFLRRARRLALEEKLP